MLYGFSELIKYLSLPGPSFEQPGTDQPESAVGADHDQDGPTLCSGSTSMKFSAPQNSTERLSKDLKKAARLSMIAGQLAVDSDFSTHNPYVDLAQVVPLSRAFGDGEAAVSLRFWDGNPESDLAIFVSPGCKLPGLQVAFPMGRGPFAMPQAAKATKGEDFYLPGRKLSDSQRHAVREPVSRAPLAGSEFGLYTFNVPQGMDGHEYVDYSEWMATFASVLSPSRLAIRSLPPSVHIPL